MAVAIIIRRMSGSWKLLNTNLNHKISHAFNANIHNLNSFKRAPLLKTRLIQVTVVAKRNIFRFFKKPTIDQLKIKDNVPDQYKLIYRNTMDRYIFLAQVITSVTAYVSIFIMILKHDFSGVDYSTWNVPPRKADNEIYVYIISFVTLIVILQLMISRLPIRIYNLPQQKKYMFIFYGKYPFSQRKLMCKVGEVAPIPEVEVSPWRPARYMMKDQQKLILLEDYFRRPADLYIMLGVQRDPDVDEK